jgi:hypothetical protein
MSFAPGQFITAQRLNRLQSKTYWAAASGTFAASQTAVDVAGTSIPVTIETNGATVAITWVAAIYAGGSAMTTNANARVFIGSDGSPVYALADWRTANDKGTVANVWGATVAAAGATTIKMNATTPANATLSVYTSIMATVHEVA